MDKIKPSNFPNKKDAYATLVQNVPRETLKDIFIDLEEPVKEVAGLVDALKVADWTRVSGMKNPMGYALLVLRWGRLTVGQFVTLNRYWFAKQNFRQVESVPLFIDGKRNSRAEEAIQKTVKIRKGLLLGDIKQLNEMIKYVGASEIVDSSRAPFRLEEKWWCEEQRHQFFKIVSNLPLSEQYLFLVNPVQLFAPTKTSKQRKYRYAWNDPNASIGEVIRDQTGFEVFFGVDRETRMLASFGMMQVFLEVATPYPVQIEPVLGIVSPEHIFSNIVQNRRVMSLPFPGLPPLPSEADGFQSKIPSVFEFHDFHHAVLQSHVPPGDRKKYICVATEAKEFENKFSNCHKKTFYHFFYRAVVDLDMPDYISLRHWGRELRDHVNSLPQDLKNRLINQFFPKKVWCNTRLLGSDLEFYEHKVGGLWKDALNLWTRDLLTGKNLPPLPGTVNEQDFWGSTLWTELKMSLKNTRKS